MKQKLCILSVVLSTLFLTSCKTGLKVFLINNTGESITVVSIGSDLVETATPVAQGRITEVPLPAKLRVAVGTKTWKYRLREAFSKSEKGHGGAYSNVFQIEKDGAIYLAGSNAKQRVESFPTQPEGFPLRPR